MFLILSICAGLHLSLSQRIDSQQEIGGLFDPEEEIDRELDALRMTIPGEPGLDYPIFSTIIDSSFSCAGTLDGEYYADMETQCQMFHICSHLENGVAQRFSFLCPNGKKY